MKKRPFFFKVKLITLFIFLICFVAQATDVRFTFNNGQYNVAQYTNVQVKLQPEQLNASGSVTILQPPIYRYTDTNGSVTFSNLAGNASGGYYRWTVPAFTSPNGYNPPVTSQGDIQVNSTNLGTVDSTTIGVAFTPVYNGFGAAWTAQASDLRYSQSTNVLTSYVQIGTLITTSNDIVALIPSTNGFTSIVFSNASSFTTPTQVSNLIVSLSNTNQFSLTTVTNVANEVYSNNPASYLQPVATNGLAGTNYVNASIVAATNGLASLISVTNLIQSATNTVAQTNWVVSNFDTISNQNYATNWVSTNSIAIINSASNSLQAQITANTNGFAFAISSSNYLQSTKQPASATLTNLSATGAFTNKVAAGQNFQITTNFSGDTVILNATNQTFLTNGMTGIVFVQPGYYIPTNTLPALTNGFVTSSITNNLVSMSYLTNYAYPTSNPSMFVTSAITNGYATTNFVQSSIYSSNAVLNASLLSAMSTTNTANLTITTNLVLASGLASTNYANVVGLASTNLTLSTSNFLSTNGLAQLKATNDAILATMNSLIGASTNGVFVSSTNGIATRLSVNGNLNLGSKTNFLISTNIIGIIGSGSSMDGTYLTEPYETVWTNTVNSTNKIILSGGNYYIQSNGVSMYQSSNAVVWTLVNGIAPAPSGAFGSYWDMNGVFVQGFVTSTNIYWQITNAIATLSPTNSGTNFVLTGAVQGWTTNNMLSTSTTNTIIALIAQYGVNPTNGISAVTATNIASSLDVIATNDLWSAVTNMGAVQWGTDTNLSISSRPATLYYFFTNGIPQYGTLNTN
jgi:hypothetical protein